MIFDALNNLRRYGVPQTEKILKFISDDDCSKLSNGQVDIDGQQLFVKVMEYEPKPASENKFETHRIYADLQYIVSGVELMQVTPQKSLTPIGAYDREGDYQFYTTFYTTKEMISDIVVEAGQFVVFYPGEAHRPSCLYQNNNNKVKKFIFKISIK